MQHPETESQSLELREFLRVLRRRRFSVVLAAILATSLALGFVAWRTPEYTSRAKVEVRPLTIDEELQPFASDSFVNMDTEAARVTQEPVARFAAPALGLDPNSTADLAKAVAHVAVNVQVNTTFLDISCTQGSPGRARTCASAFAAAYVRDRVDSARDLYAEKVETEQEKIQLANDQLELLSERLAQLSEEDDATRAQVQAEIDVQSQLIVAAQTNLLSLPTASPGAAVLARSADLPIEPSNKDYVLTGVLALILGFALGIGLALVRERLAEPLAGQENLERVLDAPVLAAVPALLDGYTPALVTVKAPESLASQAYRGAGAALLHLARSGSLKVIALTGPGQGEGKTPATGNLAVALAQSGRRVVAVSCDLRHPTLHAFLDRGNEVGLTSVLRDALPLGDGLQKTDEPGLFVLPSGPVPDNPTDLLGSEYMGQLLAELRTHFDFVLLDVAPGLVADVLFLTPHTDAVIIVADATKTSRGSIAHLRRQLEGVGGLIIGGILNNWAPRHAAYPYPSYVQSDLGARRPSEPFRDRPESHGDDRARSDRSGLPSRPRD